MATLYRKYRSKRFEEVIGQDPIVKTLTNQIKLGRIGHAYLFTGSRGTGKTTCARIFARAVNCLSPVNGSPCGECEVCKKLELPDNVDIIELDAASNNGVDDARDIREKVKYLPVACRYKVYIIDEVHMLTGGAFNALLKTIEEPPDHVIFILATTEPQKLPQTILSRCVRFDFKLVPTDILAAHIARVYDAEGIKYTPEAAEEIARLGEGSVRDALSVADMLGSASDEVTPEVVKALTGAGDAEAIAELFDCVSSRDVAGAFSAVDALSKSGKSMNAVVRQLRSYARNALVVKTVGREKAVANGLVNIDKETCDRIERSVGNVSASDIAHIMESFGEADNGLKYSVSPRLYLETALVKTICGADEADDLRRRVAALERKSNSADNAEQKKNIDNSARPTHGTVSVHPISGFSEQEPPPVSGGYEYSAERFTPPDEPPPERTSTDSAAYKAPPDEQPTRAPQAQEERRTVVPEKADEGEFMHVKSGSVSGLELLGKVATYLRKNSSAENARVRELLSRGVTVKERDDVIAFVVPDDNFLLMSEKSVADVLNKALAAQGIKKPAHVEKTAEDIIAENLIRARDLFGRDNVIDKMTRRG